MPEMIKCVRCGATEELHGLFRRCPRFEPPAPLWMRALTSVLGKVIR